MPTALQQELKTLAGRCIKLHGTRWDLQEDGTYKEVLTDDAVKTFLTTLCKDADKPDAYINQEAANMMIAALDNSAHDLRQQLAAARVQQVGNFIAAESTFRSGFFRVDSLRPDDEPYWTNNTRNEVRVSDLSEDGSPKTVRVLTAEGRHRVGLYMIASDWIQYKVLDLYRGDISAPQRATYDISRDLLYTLDRKHYTLLNAAVASGGCFGVFSTEQARVNKANRIYHSHSGIVTTHLPSTNDITNSTLTRWDPPKATEGEADLTGFRPAVLAETFSYQNRWGNFLPDNAGALRATGEIIVPSSDIENMALTLRIENSKPASSLQEQVEENGFATIRHLGINWKFIPDVTIASGICFPIFNQKVGISYEKSNMNRDILEPLVALNSERRMQSRAWGAVIISQWRPRAMRINYNA